MKKYKEVKVKIICFELQDIVTASIVNDNLGDDVFNERTFISG